MRKLTMDQAALYKIQVPGNLPEDWLNREERMGIQVTTSQGGSSITTMTGKLDQAALIGLLRKLYSLSLPLLFVNCVEPRWNAKDYE
jgi:hypothetical protein